MMRTLSLAVMQLVVLSLAACELAGTTTITVMAAPAQGGLEGVWKASHRNP